MIETERLILDELTLNDAPALFDIASRINKQAEQNPQYFPYYAFQDAKGNELRHKVISFLHKAQKEKNEFPSNTRRYAIRKDGQLIGSVAIDMLPTFKNGKPFFGDLGYFIDPNFGNQNFGREACVAVLNEFFAHYNRLDVTAHPDNIYSIRLIEKLGAEKGDYCEKSAYNDEPRQTFFVSRQNFLKRFAPQKEYE